MLVLTRKVGERIQLGDQITVMVVKIQGNAVRIGIDAPADMPIMRTGSRNHPANDHAEVTELKLAESKA